MRTALPRDDGALAQTSLGALRGIRQGAVSAWLGVPYAEAPRGDGRLRAPVPVAAWTGVRDVTAFGPACPQPLRSRLALRALGPRLDEDCLSLHIWSPGADDRRRPVLVWIHGGAFIVGSAKLFDGAHLALQGDIVVVSINYRLGALGFVNFRDALEDDRLPSNLGLRDQMAALQWVRRHIGAFGGDASRVTVAGESAGAVAIALMLLQRDAATLFDAAILQSGGLNLVHDRLTSAAVARDYLDVLGIPAHARDAPATLAAMDVHRLVDAQRTVGRRRGDYIAAAPWYDGDLLPADLASASAAPTASVPLIAGSTRDEMRLFDVLPQAPGLPRRRASIVALLVASLGVGPAARIVAAYPDTTAGDRRLATDLNFRMPTLHVAERHCLHSPTWVYRFDAAHPWLGAAHGLDLMYLWPWRGIWATLLRGAPLRGPHAALALRMRQCWIDFVHRGDPGAAWPRYDLVRRRTRLFALADAVVDDPDAHRRAAWAGQDVGLVPAEFNRPSAPASSAS